MNKFALLSICAFSLAAGQLVHAADAPPPFLVVDIGEVLAGSNEAKTYDMLFTERYQSAIQSYQSQLQELQSAYTQANQLNDALNKATDATPKDERERMTAAVKSAVDDFNSKKAMTDNLKTSMEGDLNAKRQDYLAKLITKISDKAKEIAQKRKVGAVVTKNNFLYWDPSWEITKDVIAAINVDVPAPQTTTPAAAATPPLTLPGAGSTPARPAGTTPATRAGGAAAPAASTSK